MKSSTRNLSNLHALGSDKRIEALVKKQEGEHQHLISGHHKEMQALRDMLHLSMQRFDSLFGHAEAEIKALSLQLNEHISALKEKAISSEMRIAEQRKTIEALHDQLLAFHTEYSSKSDVENFKKHMSELINYTTVTHINSFQDCQMDLKALIKSLKDDMERSKIDTEKKFSDIIDTIERNFDVTKIDREGVLKEIRIYEKTIFIIEKKIENLYTLIERINKRGDVCPRLE